MVTVSAAPRDPGERPDGRSLLIAIMTEGSRAAADETLLTEFARVFHSRVFC